MSRISYVNGVYCDYKNSTIHIEDRGYQFADGVYEVFGILDNKIVDYKGHLNRLYNSLNKIKLKSPIHKSSYIFHIKKIISKNKIKNGLVYLQITRGVASRDFKFPKNTKPSLVIIARVHTRMNMRQIFSKESKLKLPRI